MGRVCRFGPSGGRVPIRVSLCLAAIRAIVVVLLVTTDAVGAPDPGTTLSDAPEVLWSPPTVPTLARLRTALETNRPIEALRTARGLRAKLPRGRTRDAIDLAIGLIHAEAGRHNLASEAFTHVRRRRGPLAAHGAWFEAEQDFLRGRPGVAVRECKSYRERWPEGAHAGACLRLMALGLAAAGEPDAAREAAAIYDDAHTLGPITEQVEFAIARRWLAAGRPGEALPILRALAIEHDAPLTGRSAERSLLEQGPLSLTAEERLTRALSLRDTRRSDAAWEAFEQLRRIAADQPEIAARLEGEAERFGWRTRNWSFLDEWYADRYAREGNARDAWVRYRVLFRAARHDDAATFGLEMQRAHRHDRSWQRSHEDLARTLLLARRYDEARDQFAEVGRSGGWTGRRGRFFAAFATLMAGHHDDAIRRLTRIIDADHTWLVEARYWRSRALDLTDRPSEAALDRAWVLEHAPDGWYGVLVRNQALSTGTGGDAHTREPGLAHDGRWGGDTVQAMATVTAMMTPPDERPLGRISAAPMPREAIRQPHAVGGLSWPFDGWQSARSKAGANDGPRRNDSRKKALDNPPESYLRASIWNPDAGSEALESFVERYGRLWPELRAIEDLARVGLYELSGTLMADWYERWRRDYRRNRNGARRIRKMSREDWRTLFLATRDHQHAARSCDRAWEDAETDAEAVMRLAYPIVHGRTIWSTSKAHDVDPYLVLGLMRQESRYDANAVSRVGARGAMQIMPRTGHLLADRIEDTSFTAADLEDPELAIGYGIRYLGLLLDRFEGVFPLAVASYNAGPFNVSGWLQGTGPHLPIDAFVEHIPFRETRDYVKRVTANYDLYVRLYAQRAVVVPAHPAGDHPEVVDF